MRIKLLSISILLFCFLISFSFQKNTGATVLTEIQTQFTTGLNEVKKETNNLVNAAIELQQAEKSIDNLKVAIDNTRLAYKKIEFLVAYFDPYEVKKNINGAPLMTVEPAAPEVVPIDPCGLQTLDELIYSEEVFEEKEKIIKLAKKFQSDFAKLTQFQTKIKIEHRHVFEAMRQELVRVFTLGLTGFDTPGSANAIPEAQAAIEGVYGALNSYMPMIQDYTTGLAIVWDARMEYTLNYLEDNNDFETFDRLDFLKNHLDPQYHLLYELHKGLKIEMYEETSNQPVAVNYKALSIFSEDFLNPGYYANLDLDNPHQQKRVDLGKILFFDPILSENLERSCASCHQPEKAFTDGLKKSRATNKEGTIDRNSPSLVNVVYSDKYFWDLREPRLDKQMLHVIKNEHEFNTDYIKIIEKINQSEEYKQLFNEAYPEYPEYSVSTHSISDALSSYVSSLNSFDSPFDKYVRGEYAVYDESAQRGFNLFMGKAACGTCHFAPVFNGTVPPLYDESESEVLGIPTTPDTINLVEDPDIGRYGNDIPRDEAPFYKESFKTVTVRNIELTAPYMHNGVYETLEQVVDFYNRGGGAGMGLDVPHQTLPFDNLELTKQEQMDIVAFMKSLTGDMTKFTAPDSLPKYPEQPSWDKRAIGGSY